MFIIFDSLLIFEILSLIFIRQNFVNGIYAYVCVTKVTSSQAKMVIQFCRIEKKNAVIAAWN